MFKFITVLIIFSITSLSAQKADLPEETPPDFNIYVKGVNEFINTFENKFTLTFVKDTLITIDMVLSKKQKDTIYREMKNIEIFDYPEIFTPPYKDNPEPGLARSRYPHSKYILKIQVNGLEKNIKWNDRNFSQTKIAIKLREFIRLVISRP